MKRLPLLTLASLIALVGVNLPRPSPAAVSFTPTAAVLAHRDGNDLSVMTYNVEGLPFPVLAGRAEKEGEIGSRLAQLRREGRQPDVVLLQEAFIPQAKAIAKAAGYTHVAFGPQEGDASRQPLLPDPGFAAKARWLKGEDVGKWVDSGLVILSDYPIVQTRTMAFPASLCAGYDCLAAKGVLLAWVKVPGHDRPVAIADTHLNSRAASGVGIDRANTAYFGQVAALRNFIRANVPATTDVVVGGDFNVGHDPSRIAAQWADGGIVQGGAEVTRSLAAIPAKGWAATDRASVITRAKDKQYFRAGADGRLSLRGFEVPFGIENGGSELSDHLGYVADYAL